MNKEVLPLVALWLLVKHIETKELGILIILTIMCAINVIQLVSDYKKYIKE